MSPIKREKYTPEKNFNSDYKRSAVILVLCLDENDNLFIPLTQRFPYEGLHSNQVSLPGGKFEENDINNANTALRECFEEIGIEPHNIELLGDLSPLFIPVSKFLVHPVVGVCKIKNTGFKKNEREVKSIVKLYINDLLTENIVKSGFIEVKNDFKIKSPYFEVEGLIVWGATAMILSEFKSLLRS